MTGNRGRARVVVVSCLVAVLGLLGAGTALAHNSLTASDPAAGAALGVGPASVTLTFNDVVQNLQPLVTVVGPAGDRWEGSPVTVLNNTVSVPVNPLGPAGDYTIAYRVISADGHAVEGTSVFSLTVAGTGTPNPVTADQAAPSDDIPSWVWILGAVLIVAVIVVFGVVSGRRRRTD